MYSSLLGQIESINPMCETIHIYNITNNIPRSFRIDTLARSTIVSTATVLQPDPKLHAAGKMLLTYKATKYPYSNSLPTLFPLLFPYPTIPFWIILLGKLNSNSQYTYFVVSVPYLLRLDIYVLDVAEFVRSGERTWLISHLKKKRGFNLFFNSPIYTLHGNCTYSS